VIRARRGGVGRDIGATFVRATWSSRGPGCQWEEPVQPSALPVRTDRDALIADVSFHDLMAERLRQAPWLVLSAGAHAIVLLLLWVLLPPDVRERPRNVVSVADLEPPAPVVEPTPELPKTKPEPVVEPTLVEPVVAPPEPDRTESETDAAVESDSPAVESAFASLGTNPAVGLGGNAGGPYGKRPGGKPRGGGGGAGGSPLAIESALRWLRDHQDPDGKWDCDQFMKHDDATKAICDGAGNAVHDVGVTGLALLAFLGDGNTLRDGPHRATVKAAVRWLREQQQENGRFGSASSHDFVYDHAIAAYAMCEAYGLSQYQLLRDSAQRGIHYLEAHRNPYGVWRYQPRDGDNDTSVTGWAIMAYSAGKHFGLEVNGAALQAAAVWLDQVSDRTGHHGYSGIGEPSARKPGDHGVRFPVERGAAMTAVGLFSRFFLGQEPRERPVMTAAAELLVQRPPVWDEKGGAVDHYYWYYASYALFQMGGRQWTTWQKALEPAVLPHQHRDRANMNLHGSWDPVCVWGEDGGRVYSTAILALTLQANYRYSRLVR
jgi:hypothetical protein